MNEKYLRNLSRCNHLIRPIHGQPYMCPSPIYKYGLCTDHAKLTSLRERENGIPTAFVIPKGWKSMHREVEYNLCILFPEDVKLPRNEKKCLDAFHIKPVKNHRELAFNGEFNDRVTPST